MGIYMAEKKKWRKGKQLYTLLILVFCLISAPVFAADIRKNLGVQLQSFGSDKQAAELLSLMDEQPGEQKYMIDFETANDAVAFGCNLTTDTMVRIHQRPDGKGSAEKWIGDTIYRLKKAANGGSLNDTSTGKIPGTMQSF